MSDPRRHNAPATVIAVGATRRLRIGLWLLWSVGLACCLLFVLAGGMARNALASGLLMAVALAFSAWHVGYCLCSVPAGLLLWNGLAWQWHAADTPAADAGVPVMLKPVGDTGGAVLLQCRCDGCHADRQSPGVPRWLWVERSAGASAAAWLAWRRAVYSPARHELPLGADTPMPE